MTQHSRIEAGSVRAAAAGFVNVLTPIGISALNLMPAVSEFTSAHPGSLSVGLFALCILYPTFWVRGGLNFYKAWKLYDNPDKYYTKQAAWRNSPRTRDRFGYKLYKLIEPVDLIHPSRYSRTN